MPVPMIPHRLRAVLPGTGSLGARTLRAGGWSLVQTGASHVLRLASNLIMTRILVPEAFGLMAMVTTVIIAFNLFSDIGIQKSVIRERDGADPHFLRVAWMVKMLRGAVIAAGVVLCAGLLGLLAPRYAPEGTVYADPRLPWLILISALAPLFQGMVATTRELSFRRLQMGRYAGLDIFAQAVSIAAMIGFAALSPTVWALLAGMLTASLIHAVLSHVVYPGPAMRPVWDAAIADRLWQYGKWLMGSSVFTFVALNADRFILGALLDASTFGIYVIALLWIEAGRQVMTRLTDQVGFSTIGELVRDRPGDVPRLYRRFQMAIDTLCLGAFGAVFAFGPALIGLLYTPVYAEAGDYMRILALKLLVMRFDPLNGLVMNMGNSRAMMLISAARALSLCLLLPAGYALFGLTGALFAVALSPLPTVPYTLWLVRPVLGPQITGHAAWVGGILALGAALALL